MMNNIQKNYVILISSIAALGGLLFGFDTAVISGTTPFIKPYFNLDDIWLGWTVSSLLFGCIIGVISAGKPSDIFGRKRTLMVAAFLFILSAFGSALANRLSMFIFFRIIGGLGVGVASMLSPMYISEISPAEKRGRLVSFNQLAIVIGILLAFISNALLVDTGENNWRWMLAVMGAPALLFFISLFFAPESPRWLVQKGFSDKAFVILGKINGNEQARQELISIEESIKEEVDSGTFREVFSPRMRPILFIGVFLCVFSQITGINSIMYYAPVIFQSIGAAASSAVTQTAIIGGGNLIFTFVAISLIDRLGRKPLLIGGVTGMIVSLTTIATAFYLQKTDGYIILVLILMYIASFSASVGAVTWVIVSEIFPNKLRSKAMSVSIVSLWIANFLLILLFPLMLNRLGGAGSFLIFSVMCVLLLLFTVFRVPETKGRTLEELEIILIKKKNI
ncbi:MAG TPA: sugar porter family MFS transporter [Bacteroidales bacterium]|nr:sugar porter family MFS transporter [Bacteroidales bacterium]